MFVKFNLPELSFPPWFLHSGEMLKQLKVKQAGAELCQAQDKLSLAELNFNFIWTKKVWAKKTFEPKICGPQKNLGPKKVWAKKNRGPKKFSAKKSLVQKKVWAEKIVWGEKVLCQKKV